MYTAHTDTHILYIYIHVCKILMLKKNRQFKNVTATAATFTMRKAYTFIYLTVFHQEGRFHYKYIWILKNHMCNDQTGGEVSYIFYSASVNFQLLFKHSTPSF